jgi:transcriptional regulator with XRE-family HTH domain
MFTLVNKILVTFVNKEICMKERLLQLLDLEQITPSKFADIIGVQRSSVSHVISGRNKPSYDFLQKTLKAFPGLNASWLMLGEGTMYEQMGRQVSGNLFDTPEEAPEDPIPEEIKEGDRGIEQILPSQAPSTEDSPEGKPAKSIIESGDEAVSEQTKEIPVQPGRQGKRVVQVMVFYEDDTFRTYSPDQ